MKKLLIIFIAFLFSCCSTMIPQKTKIIIIKDDFGAYYFYPIPPGYLNDEYEDQNWLSWETFKKLGEQVDSPDKPQI